MTGPAQYGVSSTDFRVCPPPVAVPDTCARHPTESTYVGSTFALVTSSTKQMSYGSVTRKGHDSVKVRPQGGQGPPACLTLDLMSARGGTVEAPASLGIVDRYLGLRERGLRDRGRLAALLQTGTPPTQGGPAPAHVEPPANVTERARPVRDGLAAALERLDLVLGTDGEGGDDSTGAIPAAAPAPTAESLHGLATELARLADQLTGLADRLDRADSDGTGSETGRRLGPAA